MSAEQNVAPSSTPIEFMQGYCIAYLLNPYYPSLVKTLTVKLPDPLFSEIAGEAKVRKISKSEVVRERLRWASTGKISLWSRMEDLLIDDASLPGDLSENRTHRENYGKNRADR